MRKISSCFSILLIAAIFSIFPFERSTSVRLQTDGEIVLSAFAPRSPINGPKILEDQRAVDQFPLHPGYPLRLDYWIEKAPVTIADLDGDGKNELILPTFNTGTKYPGKIYAWDTSGSVIPGFPIETAGHVQGRLALGDLDHDGNLEIVASVDSFETGVASSVYVWRANGEVFPGWPQSVACSRPDLTCRISSISLADLDSDSHLEVIAASNNGTGGAPDPNLNFPSIYAWYSDGQLLPGNWPVEDEKDVNMVGAAAIGDLDGNGFADLAFGRDYNRLFALDKNGNNLHGWPIYVWWPYDRNNWEDDQIEFTRSAVTLADLDGDNSLEYIVNGLRRHAQDTVYYNTDLLVYNRIGARWRNWETPASGSGVLSQMTWRMLEAPAIGDINGDQKPDIVVSTQDGWVRAYTSEKQLLWEVDYSQGRFLYATETVIGDVNGDGWNEVLFGTFDPNYGNVGPVGVWILLHDGTVQPGSPLWVDTPGINGAPALGDLDGDGKIEIAAATIIGDVYVWDAPGTATPSQLPWPMARHDLQRTGLFGGVPTNFYASTMIASNITARFQEEVTYFINIRRTGAPFNENLRLTNIIPAGLSYIPGSLTATSGLVDDSQAPTLEWSGVMSELAEVEISYRVHVTLDTKGSIASTAILDAGAAGQYTLSANLIINGEKLFLPLLMH